MRQPPENSQLVAQCCQTSHFFCTEEVMQKLHYMYAENKNQLARLSLWDAMDRRSQPLGLRLRPGLSKAEVSAFMPALLSLCFLDLRLEDLAKIKLSSSQVFYLSEIARHGSHFYRFS